MAKPDSPTPTPPAPDDPKLLSNRLRAALIALVDEHERVYGIADSTVSRRAFNGRDATFVKRLRSGGNLMLDKLLELEIYLVAHRNPAGKKAA